MVMAEMEKPRDTFVLARGDYRNQTEKVQPGVPAMLPPLPEGRAAQPADAGEVARRSATSADRARRREPLLADVLRRRPRQDAGGLRRAGRAAVASGAARLAGDRVRPDRLGRPRDAAADRDVGDLPAVVEGDAGAAREGSGEPAARARPARPAAGRDDPRHGARRRAACSTIAIGGPSVLPYQPKGLWEEMAFGDGFSGQAYEQSHGRDLYRRSMYTFWKRTVPPASLATFDAPDREKCTARRGA